MTSSIRKRTFLSVSKAVNHGRAAALGRTGAPEEVPAECNYFSLTGRKYAWHVPPPLRALRPSVSLSDSNTHSGTLTHYSYAWNISSVIFKGNIRYIRAESQWVRDVLPMAWRFSVCQEVKIRRQRYWCCQLRAWRTGSSGWILTYCKCLSAGWIIHWLLAWLANRRGSSFGFLTVSRRTIWVVRGDVGLVNKSCDSRVMFVCLFSFTADRDVTANMNV